MPMIKSAYRKPLTPEGIEKMEKGELDYYEETVWSNLNTGTLEQYMNERTQNKGFYISQWKWKNVVVGIAIGMLFAIINQYVGLKVGTVVGGAWYVVYILGLSLKWKPTQINMAAGASTGTAATCTGFIFSYPAIYLLAFHPDYGNLVTADAIPPMYVAVFGAILGGMMGVLYFTIFRRVWLVEDPLPMPGFEASVKLVDLAHDISAGASDHAKKTIRTVMKWTAITAFFTFLRDFPILQGEHGRTSILDKLIGGRIYEHGQVRIPYAKYTSVGFEFIPIQAAIGWFMRLRTALLVSSGTMFTWFIIIPLAVGIDLPVYMPKLGGFFSISTLGASYTYFPYTDVSAIMAYKYVARIIAVGTILGGGLTALVKMRAVFKTAMADIPSFKKKKGEEKTPDGGFIPGKGWFEWPMSHILIMITFVPVAIGTVFAIGGFPFIPSLTFGILLVLVTFFLGAIGVKTMGETGSTPVSGTSFIVLLLLLGVFAIFKVMGMMTQSELIVLSLFGATIFGTALSLSSDIIGDFKIGTYIGTRPFHLVKGELTGLVMGATVAVIGASIFSMGLADGSLDLAAPQANAFATLVMSLMGGPNVSMLLTFLAIGAIIGVVAEVTTGMGTAFGLGMYLPLPITLPLIVGGSAREWWAKNKLEPQAKKEGWGEREITIANVDKYMMMTGLIIGEAIMGSVIAMMMILL